MVVETLIKCKECGSGSLKLVGDIGETRLYKCIVCWAELLQYIKDASPCNHEYNDKNNCMFCGLSK